MTHADLQSFSFERMDRAVSKVRDRLRLATSALENAGIRYAITGGNAVAIWVARVDEGAVRNTRDVDLLIRRADFEAVKSALEGAGLVYRLTGGEVVFQDESATSNRDGVHLIFAGEKQSTHTAGLTPPVEESERAGNLWVQSLDTLVRIKLAIWRTVDRVHLRDMLEVGLIDQSWVERFPPELGARLQHLIDTPDG